MPGVLRTSVPVTAERLGQHRTTVMLPAAAATDRPRAWVPRSSLGRRLKMVADHVNRRRWIGELALYAMTVGSTYAGVAAVMRPWRADLAVPFGYSGDSLPYSAMVKGVLEHGWFWENPSLGVPFGQQLYDHPHGDSNLHWLLIKMLGFVWADHAVVMNLFYIIGFGMTALAAVVILRALGLSKGAALLGSVLFALLPYHFIRGQAHLMLTTYYAVPLGAWAAMTALRGRTFFGFGSRPRATGRRIATVAIAITVALIIGSANIYYAAFTLLLLFAAAALAYMRDRRSSAFLSAGLLAALIVGTLAANLLPSLLYRAAHGPNPDVTRGHWQSEEFGMKLIRLVLPVDDHRIAPLAALTAEYRDTPLVDAEQGDPMGIVATSGLVVLVVVGFSSMAGISNRGWRRTRLRHLSVLVLVAIVVATVGGMSALISLLIGPEIRAWNRMSLLIAFFSLAGLGLVLDGIRSRLRHPSQAAWWLVISVLLVGGVLDQTTPAFRPEYENTRAAYRSDAAFVARIEAAMPTGGWIFQLPPLDFPGDGGEGENAIPEYELLKAYLHSTDTGWSYGSMRGRPEGQWQRTLLQQPLDLAVRALAAVGFDGIYIHRLGYVDHGSQAEAILTTLLGESPVTSDDGNIAFFGMSEYANRVREAIGEAQVGAVREAALDPLRITWGAGFYGEEGTGAGRFRWAGESASLVVENPGERPRSVTIAFRAAATIGDTVTLRGGEGTEVRRRIGARGAVLSLEASLEPGRHTFTVTTNAEPVHAPGDPRDLRVRIVNPIVVDTVLADLVEH